MVYKLFTMAALHGLVMSTTVLNFVSKPCNKKDTFLHFFGGSLHECMEECDRRTLCLSIMFMPQMNHCSLKDIFVDNEIHGLNGIRTQCMFLEKKDWVSSGLGPCNENKCNVTETCQSKEDGSGFLCLRSTCPTPPVSANAVLLSDIRTIGSTNRYICKNGYRSFGTPMITCNSNAEWEGITSFWCEQSCSEPKSSYSNAILSRKEYVGLYKREFIHLTCAKDFQGLGPTATSKCIDGKWHYDRVRCCHNGTSSIGWHHICVFYTGKLNSFSHFEGICSGRGYRRAGHHTNLAKYMIDNHLALYILMPFKKTYYERVYNDSLAKCFESENINMGNTTYDEKILYAKDNNMTQSACAHAWRWAPSEPNGGAEENCIMMRTTETLWYDIRCNNINDLDIGAFCYWYMPLI